MPLVPLRGLIRSHHFILGFVVVSVVFCVPTEASRSAVTDRTRPLRYNEKVLRSGDVIFRAGTSLTSRFVLLADRDSPYSHVGLLVKVGERISVIHVEPEEDMRIPATVKIQPLAAFLAVARASSVYRARSAPGAAIEQAVSAAMRYETERLPFDADLDLSSTDRLYCTELVWRAYLAAGIDLVGGQFDHLTVLFGHGPYLLPSRLEQSSWLTRVQAVSRQE